MAFTFTAADRAGVILATVTAIDPATLQNDRDRAARAYVLAVLTTLPATTGIVLAAHNDDLNEMNVVIRHQPFGSYAT